jgi:hypothetical protein
MYGLWVLVLAVVLVLVIAVTASYWSKPSSSSSSSVKRCCRRRRRRCATGATGAEPLPIYGEFIRPFTFDDGPILPIVQPGGSLVFPVATVTPSGVTYIDDESGTGLLVPRGTYLVAWTLNPSDGSSVNLLVNGQDPTTSTPPPLAYTQSVTNNSSLDTQYLVQAPLEQDNLISLINAGQALFTLDNIPNTHVGSTSIVTKIRVQRLSPFI